MSKLVSNDAEKTGGFGLSPMERYISNEMSSVAIKKPLDSTSALQMTLITASTRH